MTELIDQARLTTHAELLNDLGDQQGRREFSARLVRAGRIRLANDEPGPFTIPEASIQAAVEMGQFDGLAVFLDHPGFFEGPELKHLIGVTHSSYYNGNTQSANAIIRFYTGGDPDHPSDRLANVAVETLDMILKDAQEGLQSPDLGLSLVFWPIWEDRSARPRVLRAFKKIESADLVFGPAADGRIIEALSTHSLAPTSLSSEGAQANAQSEGGIPMSEPTELAGTQPDTEETPARNSEPTEQASSPPAPPATFDVSQVEAWLQAARRAAVPSILAGSGLPQAAQDRLSRQNYASPEALMTAIDQEREYLAGLAESGIVNLPGSHPRGAGAAQRFVGTISGMKTGMDAFQNAVDYIFGVQEAETPEPMLRKFDLLYTQLTGDYEFQGVFHPERIYLAAADTGTLANMAANALNKVVIAQLALLTHYRWYERVVALTPNDGSLQNMQWTSFGGISALPVVAEGNAYDELTVDDVKETDSWSKYGGYVGITREMIKNSQIQKIQAVPRALAAASVKRRSAAIAAIFTQATGTGPTLDQDSVVLFHTASHGNLATTALGTDLTAWRAAATECFKHTEVNSADRIGVFPKFCLVPPDLYHQALSLFGYGDGVPTSYIPEATDKGVGDPRPVPVAVPDWTDANDWAYLADPNVWPVIHMSFSADPSGRRFPPPELWAATSETGGLMFTSDVLPIKIRDEFVYGVNGYRGIGKRNVA